MPSRCPPRAAAKDSPQLEQEGVSEAQRQLLHAAITRDIGALRRLLGCPDGEAISSTGSSCAHTAAAAAALQQPAGHKAGLLPLHAAVLAGFNDGVKLLLEAGAPVDARTGGMGAIRAALQRLPQHHLHLEPKWMDCLCGGMTALSLAIALPVPCCPRDHDYRGYLRTAEARDCIRSLVEGGADCLLRVSTGSNGTRSVLHPSIHGGSMMLESVLRRHYPLLLAAGEGAGDIGGEASGGSDQQADNGSGQQANSRPATADAATQQAAGRAWLAGHNSSQRRDLIVAAANSGSAAMAVGLLAAAPPLTADQAEEVLRQRPCTNWEEQVFSQVTCAVLDNCGAQLTADTISRWLADGLLADLLPKTVAEGHAGAVERLLQLGAPFTWSLLEDAVYWAASWRNSREEENPHRDPSSATAAMALLETLLSRTPASALPQPNLGAQEAPIWVEEDPDPTDCMFAYLVRKEERFNPRRAVWAAEALLRAGYRPAVLDYVGVVDEDGWQQAQLQRNYSPFAATVASHPDSVNARFVSMAVEHPPWTRATHNTFPPGFRHSVRELLLAVHRTQRHLSREQSGGSRAAAADPQPGDSETVAGSGNASDSHAACSDGADGSHSSNGGDSSRPSGMEWLADLPGNALLSIIGLAAYPLSNWM